MWGTGAARVSLPAVAADASVEATETSEAAESAKASETAAKEGAASYTGPDKATAIDERGVTNATIGQRVSASDEAAASAAAYEELPVAAGTNLLARKAAENAANRCALKTTSALVSDNAAQQGSTGGAEHGALAFIWTRVGMDAGSEGEDAANGSDAQKTSQDLFHEGCGVV